MLDRVMALQKEGPVQRKVKGVTILCSKAKQSFKKFIVIGKTLFSA